MFARADFLGPISDPMNAHAQKTKYTITAAHRITGKSRTTLQKHLKKGKLSCEETDDGIKLIDASELIRVYGDACDFTREEGLATSAGIREEGASSAGRAELDRRPRGYEGPPSQAMKLLRL